MVAGMTDSTWTPLDCRYCAKSLPRDRSLASTTTTPTTAGLVPPANTTVVVVAGGVMAVGLASGVVGTSATISCASCPRRARDCGFGSVVLIRTKTPPGPNCQITAASSYNAVATGSDAVGDGYRPDRSRIEMSAFTTLVSAGRVPVAFGSSIPELMISSDS